MKVLKSITIVIFLLFSGTAFSLDCNSFQKLINFAVQKHYLNINLDSELINEALKDFIEELSCNYVVFDLQTTKRWYEEIKSSSKEELLSTSCNIVENIFKIYPTSVNKFLDKFKEDFSKINSVKELRYRESILENQKKTLDKDSPLLNDIVVELSWISYALKPLEDSSYDDLQLSDSYKEIVIDGTKRIFDLYAKNSHEWFINEFTNKILKKMDPHSNYEKDELLTSLDNSSPNENLKVTDLDTDTDTDTRTVDQLVSYEIYPDVKAYNNRANTVGVLRIEKFQAGISEFVKEKLKELTDKVDILIIDLRDNPGGSLYELKSVLNLFLSKSTPLQICRSNDGENTVSSFMGDGCEFNVFSKPVVVLTNDASASASEVFGASIRDLERGLIVGGTSFGKGTGQNVYNKEDLPYLDGSLSLTTFKWYRVTGKSVQKRGLSPDVNIPMMNYKNNITEKDYENALDYDEISAKKHDLYGKTPFSLIPVLKLLYLKRSDDQDHKGLKKLLKKDPSTDKYIHDQACENQIDKLLLNIVLKISSDYVELLTTDSLDIDN